MVGDIGGHADDLETVLDDLGVDVATGTVPEDLTVVQVGDLIDRGPDSPRVLDMVERCSATVQWVQLVGNHEAAYVGGPQFTGGEHLDVEHVALLRRWWPQHMVAAAVIDVGGPDLLVTHAGLTAGFWDRIGAPATARDAASILNDLASSDPDLLFTVGWMMQGQPVRFDAGPVWANSQQELYPSLIAAAAAGRPVPFGQVHGHSSPYQFRNSRWRNPALAEYLTVNRRARRVEGAIGGRSHYAIDPSLGAVAHVAWEPLVFTDAIIVEPNLWGALGDTSFDVADDPGDLAPTTPRHLFARLGVISEPHAVRQTALDHWFAEPDAAYPQGLLSMLRVRGYNVPAD